MFKLLIIYFFVNIFFKLQFILQILKFLFVFASNQIIFTSLIFLDLISLLIKMQCFFFIFMFFSTFTQHIKRCSFLVDIYISYLTFTLFLNFIYQIYYFFIDFFSILIIFLFYTALSI